MTEDLIGNKIPDKIKVVPLNNSSKSKNVDATSKEYDTRFWNSELQAIPE